MKADSKRLVGKIVWVIAIIILIFQAILTFVAPYDQINHIITNGLMPIVGAALMIAGIVLILPNSKTKKPPS
jgi:hypothetical protein